MVVMATAGLYETSGEWLYTIGLPGKSGIAAGSSWCHLAKAGSARSHYCSMRRATV